MSDLVVLDAAAVERALPMPAAITAVREALRAGLDPEADPARAVVPVEHGQLLLMPAQWGRYAGVKLATVAPANLDLGLPRIQGAYLLLDGSTLTPLAVLDGFALTSIRTAAVSAVAADQLAEPDAQRLVVFGSGPQGRSHLTALRAIRRIRQVVVVGRDAGRASAFAAHLAGEGSTPAPGPAPTWRPQTWSSAPPPRAHPCSTDPCWAHAPPWSPWGRTSRRRPRSTQRRCVVRPSSWRRGRPRCGRRAT